MLGAAAESQVLSREPAPGLAQRPGAALPGAPAAAPGREHLVAEVIGTKRELLATPMGVGQQPYLICLEK